MKSRVIIVEDDVELLETLVEYMELKGFEVTGTSCALDFFQAMTGACFDVAVVDIGLPDKTGFEVVEHLRTKTAMGIIILTARAGMNDKMRGYKAGADHYFVKPVDSRELVAAISSLLMRLSENRPTPSRLQDDGWTLDRLRRSIICPNKTLVKLTEKETDFLQLLMENAGTPVPKEALLKSLHYTMQEPYASRALAVMVTRLRNKMRDSAGVEAPIKSIRTVGYSFSGHAHLA